MSNLELNELNNWTAERLTEVSDSNLDKLIVWADESMDRIEFLGLVTREKSLRHLKVCHNPEDCDWSPFDF